jgi:hypothetical protein
VTGTAGCCGGGFGGRALTSAKRGVSAAASCCGFRSFLIWGSLNCCL